jgi:proteasome assembly chaperone (PAC2) family protein
MITFTRTIKPKNCVLIAAWPGMGSVALRAGSYLKDKLNAVKFAQVEPKDYFYPIEAFIEEGLIKTQELPKGEFYYWQDKNGKNDLVIFVSEAQPSPEKSQNYLKDILDLCEDLRIKTVYTFAAMPMPIDHFQDSSVWATATNKKLLEDFKQLGAKSMDNGQISGLNGLFLSFARERKLQGACLLGEIPLYTVQIENPKASLAVLEVLTKSLGIELDFNDLASAGKSMEDEIEKLIDYLKRPFEEGPKPISDEEIEKMKKILEAQSRLPESIKKKIEDLFDKSQKDIGKASELKKELDAWNVYKEFEDRFLDLFRKQQKKDN